MNKSVSSTTFLHIGKIFGLPLRLHISWFLIAFLVTWSLSSGYFPQEFRGWSKVTYWFIGSVTALLFFVSVILHELGHSLVAMRDGVPVYSITLFIFGGVAHIGREPASPGSEFRISIAGPLVSLILAFFFAILGLLFGHGSVAGASALSLGRINLMMVLFNMLPGFPLDGGRVLRAIFWKILGDLRTASRWAVLAGTVLAFTFVAGGAALAFNGYVVNGVWLVFVGWFLKKTARNSYQNAIVRERLEGITVEEVMTRTISEVPAGWRLAHLAQDRFLGANSWFFFVSEGGFLRGMLTLDDIQALSQDERGRLTADQVMVPIEELHVARPNDDVYTLLTTMDEADLNQVVVIENGDALGVITRDQLLSYIQDHRQES